MITGPITGTPLQIDTSLDDGATLFWSVSSQLDNTVITMTFEWSTRAGVWVFSAFAPDGSTIIAGQVIELFKDLFRYAINPLRPQGQLVPLTLAGSTDPPGLGELAGRVGIYYLEPGTTGAPLP